MTTVIFDPKGMGQVPRLLFSDWDNGELTGEEIKIGGDGEGDPRTRVNPFSVQSLLPFPPTYSQLHHRALPHISIFGKLMV